MKRIGLYVPSNVKGEVRNDLQRKHVEFAQMAFTEKFGGSTTIKSEGTFLDKKGNYIKEDIFIVYVAFLENRESAVIELVKTLANDILFDMKQESISIESDNNLYFLD